MFRKKTHNRPLQGCCSRGQEIEMWHEMYAKAAKERDEAMSLLEKGRHLIQKQGEQFDQAIKCAKDALELAKRMSIENVRLMSLLQKAGIDFGEQCASFEPCDWLKKDEEIKEEQK